MKRNLFTGLILALSVCCCLTGCMGGDEGGNEPGGPENFMPDVSASPAASAAPSLLNWADRVAEIERNIMSLSEIAEARVAVSGSTAVVGVVFEDGYAGGMTERIHRMVAAEVMAADSGVKTVAVTAEGDRVAEIAGVSDRLKAGETAEDLKADISRIAGEADMMK